LVLEKAFWGALLDLYHLNDIFCHLAHPAWEHSPRGGAGTGHCLEYSARSLYAGHRLPPV